MLNLSFSPWPCYTEEEANAVQEVLLSNKVNYWTGEQGRQFEQEFAKYLNCKYAVAVSNGTVAIELALKALEIGPGDEVIVTSRTFLASVSAIVLVGATPVFADVDEDSQNISAETIVPHISNRTRAIIAVHLAGWPCDMDPIMQLAQNHDLVIIEDCAQAHGARYNGQSVGTIGHVGAWSFCQDKIMTTGGEGGMVTTNDRNLWMKMWSYKDHGKSWEAVYEKEYSPGFRWLHESFGTNWRMTEMQAAIGRIQLRRMEKWHASRTENANKISEIAGELSALRVPVIPSNMKHAWYKYYTFIHPEKLKPTWNRDRIMESISISGVPCFAGSCSEVYLEKAFDETGWRPSARLPIARELGKTSLMLLVHPTLTQDEIGKTTDVLVEVITQATL